MSILKQGLKGAPVKRLQEKLGLIIDGDFGPATMKAVKAFQTKAGLVVDGIAGPDTFAAMGLHELVLLRVGSRGAMVKKLQEALSIGADGIFGNGTKASVTDFQKSNGLDADGMAGPETLSKLDAFKKEVTPEVVKKAEVQPDEEKFETEPLPELKGSIVIGNAAVIEPPKSVWGKVKGWFG